MNADLHVNYTCISSGLNKCSNISQLPMIGECNSSQGAVNSNSNETPTVSYFAKQIFCNELIFLLLIKIEKC